MAVEAVENFPIEYRRFAVAMPLLVHHHFYFQIRTPTFDGDANLFLNPVLGVFAFILAGVFINWIISLTIQSIC